MKFRELIEKSMERGVDLDSEMKISLTSGGSKLLDVDSFMILTATGEANKIIFEVIDND